MDIVKKYLPNIAWALGSLVCVIAFVAWGQGIEWRLRDLSAYSLFPLFGSIAFSLMWTHYIVSAKSLYLGLPYAAIRNYFKYTSLAVLVAILLHPSILVWRLWRDGFGLPPNSYLQNYVAAGSKWAVSLGTLALFLFLAYEFHRKYRERSWWRYVSYSSDIAMIFIFFHALELSPRLQSGWFRTVWFFYGASYLVAVIYLRFSKNKLEKERR